MTHYLGMPEATSATIDADGWLHTGDLGSMDDAGNITFRGRIRDVIIRGGENIYPEQVEAAYQDAPGSPRSPSSPGRMNAGERSRSGLSCSTPTRSSTKRALEDLGRRRLAGFQVPPRWVVVDELPLTASGKVRKVELERHVRELPQDDTVPTEGLRNC